MNILVLFVYIYGLIYLYYHRLSDNKSKITKIDLIFAYESLKKPLS